jgi:hypothetical protein
MIASAQGTTIELGNPFPAEGGWNSATGEIDTLNCCLSLRTERTMSGSAAGFSATVHESMRWVVDDRENAIPSNDVETALARLNSTKYPSVAMRRGGTSIFALVTAPQTRESSVSPGRPVPNP